ncbi:MAG: hypothetical protein WC586_05885 [Methanoregula sp.]
MDKKDIMFSVLALVILLIIAIVIKPIATGQPVNIGLPTSPTPVVTVPGSATGMANSLANSTVVPGLQSPSLTQIPVTVPTPVPTWDTRVKTVDFVDPSTYGVSLNQSFNTSTRIDSIPQTVNMTTYATFSGHLSGTTQIMNIPFPYWELWYSVDPLPEKINAKVAVTPGKGDYGAGGSFSDISGSYTTVKPEFTLQVMDANDPNRIVRVITPPGGIDLNLWLGIAPTAVSVPYENPNLGIGGSILKPKVATEYEPKTVIDPRPWKEKFFEGQRNYYFIINSQNLKSYKIDIKIPTKYIGKF